MDTIKINKGSALIVAHRGLSGLERENTASAFVAAGNRSYFGIETDVRVTADGNFVLLHDDNTLRCGGDAVAPSNAHCKPFNRFSFSIPTASAAESTFAFPKWSII